MTTPPDRTRVETRIQADPWVERDVATASTGDRLHAEQPESGLLWVLSGTVVVERERRRREVRPGTVVSYRLGPELAWSASEGTLVRWSGRPVRLERGEVASWTANLALEATPPAEPETRRRTGRYAIAAIALTWIVALTVAWCYHQAQSTTSPPSSETNASWMEKPGRTALAAEVADLFADANHEPLRSVALGGPRAHLDVWLAVPRASAFPEAEFRTVTDLVLQRWPVLRRVRVVLVDDGETWAEASYLRDGSVTPRLYGGVEAQAARGNR